jgi:hypothetical protein
VPPEECAAGGERRQVLLTGDRRQPEDAAEEAVDEITRQSSLAERDVLVAGTLADLVAVRTKGWQKADDELIGDESIGRPRRLRQ